MYQVIYRCTQCQTKVIWRDDVAPVYDLNVAIQIAYRIAIERRTQTFVQDDWGRMLWKSWN